MAWRSDNRPLLDPVDISWRDRFVLTREATTGAERQELARSALRGELVRLRRGVYVARASGEFPEDRHRDVVRAASLDDLPRVFSHRSAAAVWRLPRLDPWPNAVDVLETVNFGRRSTDAMIRHRTSIWAPTELVEGVRVTSLTRTAVDVARIDSIASGVVAVDAALAGLRHPDGSETRSSHGALRAELDQLSGMRGVAGAAWVVEFADGRAEFPGESLSRLQIHRGGLTPPMLQHEFRDEEGSMFADFFWPEFDLIGEFDGAGKYLPGRPPELLRAVLLKEKRREDRLRNIGPRVIRWDWAVALDRNRLRSLLFRAGVR